MLTSNEAVELIQGKLFGWAKTLIEMLPNLALAALIVVIGWLLAKFSQKMTKRILSRVMDSTALVRLISSSIYLLVNFTFLFAALSIMHLDKTVTSILAGAGIIGLALGFAFQDIASNFIAGVMMAAQRPIHVGELIETDGHLGVVEKIDLRTTQIRNLQGIQVIIPNKDVFQTVLMNYTRNGTRRVELIVGVSYGDDLEKVRKVTLDAVGSVSGLLPDHPVELFYREFSNSSINYEVRFWITSESQGHYNDQLSQAIMAIKAAYARESITIPFPIRTLDFGIKGGEKLSAMLSDRARG